MMRHRQSALGFLLLFLALTGAARASDTRLEHLAPQRVVSINLCADQLAMMLLPPERLVSVTWLARDPELSSHVAQAKSIPVNHGQVEEVLHFRPDLVMAGIYSPRTNLALLRAYGVPVLEIDMPTDFDGIRRQVADVADRLGVADRGQALLAQMDAHLRLGRPIGADQPTVLGLAPGGFTGGRGTLAHAVMAAAGLLNYAERKGMVGYGYLSLETIVVDPPDFLLSDMTTAAHPSMAEALLQHPALRRAVATEQRIKLPGPMLGCGNPETATAVPILAAAAARWSSNRISMAGHPAAADGARESAR